LIDTHTNCFPQGPGHIIGPLIAVVRVFAHGLEDYSLHCFRDIGVQCTWQRQRVIDVLHNDGKGGIRVERNPPCHHLVKHNSQGIDVAALIASLTLTLLWRHIGWRSGDSTGQGVTSGAHDARDAKVGQHHLSFGGKHDIGWLQVAVDHAA
jgi:hypothetical protein